MDEKLFRYIASEYVRQDGAELRHELDEMTQGGVPQITPSLDRRVFTRIRAIKRARYRRATGLIAACLALALIIPVALRTQQEAPPQSDISSATPDYAIIPLSFELPEQFTVAAVEQDVEKTVYYIEDAALDDIVMTLQYADDLTLFRELTPVTIGAYTAYGTVEAGYSLLAFERDGILYILTCEHDLNTLIKLSKNILV